MSLIDIIEVNTLCFPLKRPFSNHVRFITHINAIEIKISTNTGIIGHGFVYGLGIITTSEIVKHLQEDLIPKLFEISESIKNADELLNKWTEFWTSYKNSALKHDQLYALTCADISIWDILTKTKKVSLHEYLGAAHSKIPAYGTTGWLSLTQEELVDECKSYISNGVNAFKVRLGHADDYLRLKTLRHTFGKNLTLMLDANQRYSVDEAAQISQQLSEFNILWLEEPTDNLLANIKKIKEASKLPIALGENILHEEEFEEICKQKMTNYLQPDVPRCGGITGFCKVAEIALKHKMPICNHLLFELSASLIAAYPNGFMLEYDNFIPPNVFSHDFSAKNGCVTPPSTLGTGVEITANARKQYLVDSYIFKTPQKLHCKL